MMVFIVKEVTVFRVATFMNEAPLPNILSEKFTKYSNIANLDCKM